MPDQMINHRFLFVFQRKAPSPRLKTFLKLPFKVFTRLRMFYRTGCEFSWIIVNSAPIPYREVKYLLAKDTKDT